ncbi:MAG: type II toxin-antitoxin system HicB family antitoxin [Calditrichaceae bacterium]|nr:type II toxin-antitoxin system HicB family antitoxin [Calditrichaceae bacterium]
MENSFTAIYKKIDNMYVAYVAELPGANTQGYTLDEARENLKEAVAMVLQGNRELSEAGLDNDVIREELNISA